MLQKILTSSLYPRVCCFILFFVAASASFSGFYDHCHLNEDVVTGAGGTDSIDRMLDGTADRPWVYRQMLLAVSNWADRIVPQTVKTSLYDHEYNNPNGYFITGISTSPIAKNRVFFFRYLVLYVATFLFTLLAVYAMYLVCRAMDVPMAAAVFAPVIFILLVPYIMDFSGCYYDYSELALFALAVWITVRFDWWWAIPIAILGTWNKESFLLIILTLYPLLKVRHSRLAAFLGVTVLCAISVAVYYLMRVRFATNPGSTVIMQWHDQLMYFSHPRALLFPTQETYGIRVLKLSSVGPMALLVWTVWRGWRRLPLAIKRHGQIAAAINVPLYLLFCTPGELRDLSMLYVVFLLILAVNLNDWIDSAARARAPQASSTTTY